MGECRTLMTTILFVTFILGFVFGFCLLIVWLAFITQKIKFNVTDATLTQFNLTNDNQLHYNLLLFFTVRNPNARIGIYYDRIEAAAIYKGQKFDAKFLVPFYQSRRSTSLLRASFEGKEMVLLQGEKVLEFDSEKIDGVFGIDVELDLRIRLKFGLFKIIKSKLEVSCGFKVPLSSNGRSVPSFQLSGCDVDY